VFNKSLYYNKNASQIIDKDHCNASTIASQSYKGKHKLLKTSASPTYLHVYITVKTDSGLKMRIKDGVTAGKTTKNLNHLYLYSLHNQKIRTVPLNCIKTTVGKNKYVQGIRIQHVTEYLFLRC